ncbi:hypothetical protein HYC85_021637 [Camellia sinensis]|uniref:Uncharacterized protein n=1 Tax=Camellia sinensis TaxID=4442 RepID=A0A7J7GI72_CAMSI|nr:hypothetical protein HYC85_021637 [Camellia sinensis]
MLPWLTMAVFANIGGWIADTLVSKGLSVTTVRKARTIYNSALFCEHTYNAINWIFGACLLPYTPEPCQDTCFSSAMHGMQSGLFNGFQFNLSNGSYAFSVWPLLQSPRHWAPICYELSLSLSYTKSNIASLVIPSYEYNLFVKGVLLGLSNTAGVLVGVFGTAATGYILQKGASNVWHGLNNL